MFTLMKKNESSKKKEAQEEVLKSFGSNLKKIREEKEITQENLAFYAGFTRSYYTDVERGKRNISLFNMVKLASVLEVELNEVIKISKFKKLLSTNE